MIFSQRTRPHTSSRAHNCYYYYYVRALTQHNNLRVHRDVLCNKLPAFGRINFAKLSRSPQCRRLCIRERARDKWLKMSRVRTSEV